MTQDNLTSGLQVYQGGSFDPTPCFRRVPVLDKGHVELFDAMVCDPLLKVVNAARVSFGKESQEFSDRDAKLLKYLDDHKHHSTFRHSYFSFRVKAPLCVFRQWWKHQVGCEWVEDECPPSVGSVELPSTSWNELSGRYVEFEPEFYVPATLRLQSSDNKQGSHGDASGLSVTVGGPFGTTDVGVRDFFVSACHRQYRDYRALVDAGVAREQCRMLLPQNVYSECVLTLSLQALMYFLGLRLKPDAQAEIREYAAAIWLLVEPLFRGALRPA